MASVGKKGSNAWDDEVTTPLWCFSNQKVGWLKPYMGIFNFQQIGVIERCRICKECLLPIAKLEQIFKIFMVFLVNKYKEFWLLG